MTDRIIRVPTAVHKVVRVGGLPGPPGDTIELRVGATAIEYKYTLSATWLPLIDLVDITGPAGADGTDGIDGTDGQDGASVELTTSGTHIQWRVAGDPDWINLIALTAITGPAGTDGTDGTNGIDGTDGIDGDDGREVEFQKSATHVQWRYVGEGSWTNLVSLTELTGPPGDDGADGTNGIDGTNGTDGTDGIDGREVEFQKTVTHVQWRYVGEASWTNLIALTDITGPAGEDGADGVGTEWIEGNGAPGSLEALPGTFYLDKSSGGIWKNTSGGEQLFSAFDELSPPSAGVSFGAAFTAGVEFYVTTDCDITAILWWQPSTTNNAESRAGRLYNAVSGALVATATSAAPAGTGWQRLEFSTPVALTANTRYRVGVFHASGFIARTFDYFASASDLVDGPLVVPNSTNATDGEQGSYSTSGTISFPGSTVFTSNYWIDVEISLDADWTLLWEPEIPTIAWDDITGKPSTFPPSTHNHDDLYPTDAEVQTLIDARVPDPSSEVDDRILITLDGELVFADVPEGGAAASQTIFGTTALSTSAAGDSTRYELGTVFTVSLPITVTHIRVYAGAAAATTSQEGRIWDSAGNELAVVALPNTHPTGWAEYPLSTPLDLDAGDYTAAATFDGGSYFSNAAASSTLSGDGRVTAPVKPARFTETPNARPTTEPGTQIRYGVDIRWVAAPDPIESTDITDSTTVGRAVLTAATQADARAAIDFTEALQDAVSAMVTEGSRISKAYDDTSGALTLTVKSTASPTFSDTRAVLTTGAGTVAWANPFGRTMTIVGVYANVITAPTGAALIIDVNKNGTTIFTTQSNRPTIAAGTTSDASGAPDVTSVAAGDTITVDIDQVGSTVAGGILVVTVVMEG